MVRDPGRSALCTVSPRMGVDSQTGPATGPVRRVPAEVVVVLAMHVAVAIAVLVAYTKTPPGELINVRRTGLSVGVADAIAYLVFPLGPVTVAVLLIVWAGLGRREAVAGAVVAIALVAVMLLPGVIEAEEVEVALSPQRVIGAACVLALVVVIADQVRRGGVGGVRPVTRLDWARLVVVVGVLGCSLPWIAADLTLSLDRVPGLSSVFLTDTVIVGDPTLPGAHPAVHDGHHHGWDGALLLLSAVILSRTVRRVPRVAVREALTALLCVLAVYGGANAVQDFWNEQVVKRGTSDFRFPLFTPPWLGAPSLTLLGITVAVYAVVSPWARSRIAVRWRDADGRRVGCL